MLNRSAYYKQHAFDSKLGSKSKSKHPRYILSSLHSSSSNWKQDRRNRNDWNHFQSIQLQFLPLLSVKFAAVKFPDIERRVSRGVGTAFTDLPYLSLREIKPLPTPRTPFHPSTLLPFPPSTAFLATSLAPLLRS